ncbi:MAG: hypothetical protein ACREK5_03025 [Gemmatimonadota bacterium]
MRAASPALFVSILLAGAASAASGQTPYDPDRNQTVGALAGAASGAGVMYQEILPSAFGYRGALVLWNLGDFSFFDVGVSGLRVLSDDGRQRMYLVGSLGYWRRSDEEREPLFDDQGNVTGERVFDDIDDSWALGFGVGLETPVGERVAVNLEAAFTYWADSGDLLPLPQIGIGYRF